jgi:putative phosphonate metabolism protein
MTDPRRYAIYFSPRPGETLHAFGTGVLGRDTETADDVPFFPSLQIAWPAWREMTRAAWHYGFHATLKAPFELADGYDAASLHADVEALAARLRPLDIGRLRVTDLGRFVALVPEVPTDALTRFAATIVEALDTARAPLSAADRARRNPEKLTDRQRSHLDRWGYPYVFDEFRFHMTLTGPLAPEQMRDVVAQLADLYCPFDEPVVLDALCICVQADRSSPFLVLSRHMFAP